jgi:caffeoyl-CoA O-methyltransferase
MIVNRAIEKYILDLLPARDQILAEMETEAESRRVPIVGPAVGSFLAVLVRTTRARRVFELGSAIGYSTLWIARAAGEDAEVHYSDSSAANAERATEYFRRAGVSDRMRIHVGDALTALSQVPGEFDLIFNDVDKEGYPDVLAYAASRLRRGGLLVADNTLWHEMVLKPSDAASRAVVEFNRKLFNTSELASCMIPLRDGLTLSVRL